MSTSKPFWQSSIARALLAGAFGLVPICVTAKIAKGQDSASERWLRVVWQDREDKSLKWGDFYRVGPQMTFQKGGAVKDFPVFDRDHIELVQMERVENALLVGVRDDNDGKTKSGWVGIDLQVFEEPHGDHSDYTYGDAPKATNSVLDGEQGNPAHLYLYDREFYLANDQLNGFSRFSVEQVLSPKSKPTFYRGGGGHITLAAVDKKVAYSCWIGAGGQKGKGKIDVVNLAKSGDDSIAYSIESPTGGLHGAISNSGRVFFAPSDGIVWVDADRETSESADSVTVHHIPLGEDPQSQRPFRTGAFSQLRNWVIFTTGKGDDSSLGLIDASHSPPKLVKLPIPVQDGLSLVTPEIVSAASGKHFAFVFQDRRAGDIQEKLSIVDLDPNSDSDFSDAVVFKTIEVGGSLVDGHYGHHSVSVDDDARFAVLTNPADGEIVLMSLDKMSILSKHKVGGIPTKVIAIGGEASKH